MWAIGHLIANVKFEQLKMWATGHLIANEGDRPLNASE